MSNRKKIKLKNLTGFPGGNIAGDGKGRCYPVLSQGGFRPGAVAGRAFKRGVQGDYSGTCMRCMQPTDTGLMVGGVAEVHHAFLMSLGLAEDEALRTAQTGWEARGIWDGNPDHVPGGYLQEGYRICASCAPDGMTVRMMPGPLNLYRLT